VKTTSRKGATRGGSGRASSHVPEPLRRVKDDFEDEYPGASALATECFENLLHAGHLLIKLHDRQSRQVYQLSPSARQVLAVVKGAGQPLEPSVIAERVLITTGTMTAVLDTLEKRGLIKRMPHPDDRRKLLVDVTPDAKAILDKLLLSLHARERKVISGALSTSEQRELLRLIAKVQQVAIQESTTPPENLGLKPSHARPAAKRRVT
jgi:MarR family transcriptional regulator, 2-MHQ and catechol-resistance regulon repressor